MADLRALEINMKRTFRSSIRWSDGPSKTGKPSNRAHRPRRETVHITDRKKRFEATWEGKFTVMYKIHHHLSTRLEKKRKKRKKKKKKKRKYRKRQSKPFMHPVTPRGTQCDSLEIIAGVVSPIIATRWKEKVNFVLKWQFFRAHSWHFMCWKRLVLMFWEKKKQNSFIIV